MRSRRLLGGTVLVLAAAWVAGPMLQTARRRCPTRPTGVSEAQAITAWARKYGVSCNVCHVAGYKLTNTGQKFLRGGHKMPGSDPEKDPNLSDHLSMTAKIRYVANAAKTEQPAKEDQKSSKSWFEQHALSLYAGGPLSQGFSYFAEFYLHENEKKFSSTASEKNESDMGDWGRSKLAEAYLQYHKWFGDDAFVTGRMGRIMSTLVHLHGGGARLEFNRPLPFTSTTSTDNPYRPFNRQYGASLGGGLKDVYAEVGVVNGTGKHENAQEVDTDNRKDVFATLDYSLGNEGSMIGLYYYKGYWPSNWFGKTGGGNSFHQYGAMGNYTFAATPRLGGALIAAVFTGNDRYRAVAAGSPEQSHHHVTYYVEGQGHFNEGKLAPYVRWEYFDPDKAKTDDETLGPALGLHWKPFDYGRFVAEYTRQLKRANPKRSVDSTGTLELQYMF